MLLEVEHKLKLAKISGSSIVVWSDLRARLLFLGVEAMMKYAQKLSKSALFAG